jgi:excisionase family DNA binding protein
METVKAIQLYRVIEVCARLAMSRSSIYREIEAGNLKAIKRGKSLRISAEEIARYVESLPASTTKTF